MIPPDDPKKPGDTIPPAPANDTERPPAPGLEAFGEVDVVPPSTVPPIPRGKARETLLATLANFAHAAGELEAVAMALATGLDATAEGGTR